MTKSTVGCHGGWRNWPSYNSLPEAVNRLTFTGASLAVAALPSDFGGVGFVLPPDAAVALGFFAVMAVVLAVKSQANILTVCPSQRTSNSGSSPTGPIIEMILPCGIVTKVRCSTPAAVAWISWFTPYVFFTWRPSRPGFQFRPPGTNNPTPAYLFSSR